jgi:hypothetical protein
MVAQARLHGPGLDVEGRVTFVRPRGPALGTLQLDVERDGRLHNATLLATGRTTAFTDGVPRAVRPDEERALAVLAALFAWPRRPAERRPLPAGARVVMPDGEEYTWTMLSELPAGPHGSTR